MILNHYWTLMLTYSILGLSRNVRKDFAMSFLFNLVADGLRWIASVTGLTYNEINIVAYYIVLPFVYVALVDRILRRHILKAGYVLFWAVLLCVIRDFRVFSDWLFQRSVDFLLLFGRFGLNYVAASVVVCVVLPVLVFAGLCLWAFPSLRPRRNHLKNAPPASPPSG
jgi:hypothetical protein